MKPNFHAIINKAGCPCHVHACIRIDDKQKCINIRDIHAYTTGKEYTFLVSSLQHPHITTTVQVTHAELWNQERPTCAGTPPA